MLSHDGNQQSNTPTYKPPYVMLDTGFFAPRHPANGAWANFTLDPALRQLLAPVGVVYGTCVHLRCPTLHTSRAGCVISTPCPTKHIC
jgi:hypothetical protein